MTGTRVPRKDDGTNSKRMRTLVPCSTRRVLMRKTLLLPWRRREIVIVEGGMLQW
jgi:hypothetical protein